MTPIKVQHRLDPELHGELVEFVGGDGFGPKPIVVWEDGKITSPDLWNVLIEGTAPAVEPVKTQVIPHEPEIGIIYRLVAWADQQGIDLRGEESVRLLACLVDDSRDAIAAHNRIAAVNA